MFFRVLKRAFCYILLDWINLQEKIATLLRYMWTLYVNIMASLWLHNSKFTSCTKTFLNPYTWQFLKTYRIPKPHRNYTEELCQPGYFEKNKPYQTLPFIFLFFSGMFPLLFEAAIFSLWLPFRILVLENFDGNCRVFLWLKSTLPFISNRCPKVEVCWPPVS